MGGFEGALRAPSHPESRVTCGPGAPAACWCLGSQGPSPPPCSLGEHIPSLCNCLASTTSPQGAGRASALRGELHAAEERLRWQRLGRSGLISRRLPLPGAPHQHVKPPEPGLQGPPGPPCYNTHALGCNVNASVVLSSSSRQRPKMQQEGKCLFVLLFCLDCNPGDYRNIKK